MSLGEGLFFGLFLSALRAAETKPPSRSREVIKYVNRNPTEQKRVLHVASGPQIGLPPTKPPAPPPIEFVIQ